MIFKDRTEAGKLLAEKLEKYVDKETVILALPRGGVVVAAEIAKNLNAPLDLVIVRKIGHPMNPEYAIGALADGEIVLNQAETDLIDKNVLERIIDQEKAEAQRRRTIYLADKKGILLKNKTVILVDDGLATGLTVEAAILAVKKQTPKKIIVAVPVAPQDTFEKLKSLLNEIVVLELPIYFAGAIGAYYENFSQVSDEEVIELLKNATL